MIKHLTLLNPKYNGYEKGLALMIYKFFIKRLRVMPLYLHGQRPYLRVKNENNSNKELAKKLDKPIIRKFKERILYSSFIDNIWGADLADM